MAARVGLAMDSGEGRGAFQENLSVELSSDAMEDVKHATIDPTATEEHNQDINAPTTNTELVESPFVGRSGHS